jgi:hypothetical protein
MLDRGLAHRVYDDAEVCMELFVGVPLYLVGAGLIGVVAAWATRQVASGAGVAWRADGWPRGVQEEEPSSDWGARFRTPAAVARRLAEAEPAAMIEELAGAGPSDVPLQPVRR